MLNMSPAIDMPGDHCDIQPKIRVAELGHPAASAPESGEHDRMPLRHIARRHLMIDQVRERGGAANPPGQPHCIHQPVEIVLIIEEVVLNVEASARITARQAQPPHRFR
jgi:hypothetical protein